MLLLCQGYVIQRKGLGGIVFMKQVSCFFFWNSKLPVAWLNMGSSSNMQVWFYFLMRYVPELTFETDVYHSDSGHCYWLLQWTLVLIFFTMSVIWNFWLLQSYFWYHKKKKDKGRQIHKSLSQKQYTYLGWEFSPWHDWKGSFAFKKKIIRTVRSVICYHEDKHR